MLIQRANKYRSEPAPYQAQAMGQWVGTRRHEVNHALERRQYEYRNYAFFPLLRTSGEGIDRPARRHRLDRLRSRPRLSIRPSRIGHSVPADLCRPWRLSEAAEEVQERLLHAAGRRRPIQAPEQEPRCHQSSQDRLGKPLNAFDTIRNKLAKLQRHLARKIKHSSNWRKLKQKIARLRHHEANARKDWLHQLSTEIATSHGIGKLEKLRIKNMSASAAGTVEEPGRNVAAKSGLNRSILDQGWGMFADMLGYKFPAEGGERQFAAPPYTSQGCRMCGVVDPASRVCQDKFVCTACGHTEHADTNAAGNIEQARIPAIEPPKRIRRRVARGSPGMLRMRFNSRPGMAMGLARWPENLSAGGRGRSPRFQAGEHVTFAFALHSLSGRRALQANPKAGSARRSTWMSCCGNSCPSKNSAQEAAGRSLRFQAFKRGCMSQRDLCAQAPQISGGVS
jgi:Putative transposase DNA-binding domain/Probable transposase/Helix-turn-helix domain